MRLAYAFDPHYAVSVTQVDLLPHQVDAVYRHILPWPRIRFLLADDPGLGKTIMAGLVLKELKARGVLRRTLLVVPAHLQDQWQREMADWFREDFVAPGHPLLDHALQKDRPVRAVLADEKGRDGSLWIYRARLQDGRGKPVLERLIALFGDRNSGEIREVDPRMIWELEALPEDVALSDNVSSALQAASQETKQRALERLGDLQTEAQGRRQRECAIKERWLEASYKQLISESDTKLADYLRRRDAGEEMGAAIRQEQENLKALLKEHHERLDELKREQEVLVLEPELEAVAVILPKAPLRPEAPAEDEEAKRRVEEAGMQAAMAYERQQGREPKDMSKEFLGYDIDSHGTEGTRYIEVKAFATTGPLELTPHEWQMAQRLQDAYWLYVVEDALGQPRLHPIPNPAVRLQAQPVTAIVKIVVGGWKEEA
jgi:hypothetical protein